MLEFDQHHRWQHLGFLCPISQQQVVLTARELRALKGRLWQTFPPVVAAVAVIVTVQY